MAATGGAYEINPTAVSAVTSNVDGLASHTGGIVREMESTILQGLSFAQIGSAVAGANAQLHGTLMNCLGQVMNLIGQTNSNVQQVADSYVQTDSAVAQGFAGNLVSDGSPNATLTSSDSSTTTPTDSSTTTTTDSQSTTQPDPQATTGTDTQSTTQTNTTPTNTAATQAAVAGQQAAGNHLDPAVVDRLMAAEGASGEQGGIPEAYGFRQNMHNGYDEIMAARAQYGQGSPEERAVVAGLLEHNAAPTGALNFSDPGMQAAVISAAHMRGPGGAQAILSSMLGAPIQRVGHLTPDDIQQLQNMNPQDFQQSFHDTRLQYDQVIYGNTITHQNGQTDTYWHRYGHGLTDRYAREQQQFTNMSLTNPPWLPTPQ